MSGRVDTETKLWLKNCQHWEKQMAKRLIEGKKKSKGKQQKKNNKYAFDEDDE